MDENEEPQYSKEDILRLLEELEKEEEGIRHQKVKLKETIENCKSSEKTSQKKETTPQGTKLKNSKELPRNEKSALFYKQNASEQGTTSEASKYNKKKGVTTTHGAMFEVKMCTLILLKLLKRGATFNMCSNLAEAGDFDDVVVQYSYVNEQYQEEKKTLFIQLKLAEKKNIKRTISFLHGYFDLHEYFLSFCDCDSIDNPEHKIFSSDKKERLYILYTNADVDRTATCKSSDSTGIWNEFFNLENIFTIKNNEECKSFSKFISTAKKDFYSDFKSFEDMKKEMISFLENSKRDKYKKILNIIRDSSFDQMKNSFMKIECTESCKVEHFIPQKEENHRKLSQNKKDISVKKALEIFKKYKVTKNCSVEDFVSQTKVCCNQMDISEMDISIKKDLEGLLTISPSETETVFTKLIEEMTDWWENKNFYLTEKCQLWLDLVCQTESLRFQEKEKELLKLGVSFSEDIVSKLSKQIIGNTGVLNIICAGEETLLTSLKVYHWLKSLLPQSHILVGMKECTNQAHIVWNTWPNWWCKTLVIDCEHTSKNNDQLVSKVCASLRNDPHARLILISAKNNNLATYFKNTRDISYNEIKDTSVLNQLDDASQKKLFQKEINFQGKIVPISVLVAEEKLETLMSDPLEHFIMNDKFIVGEDLTKQSPKEYMPRNLQLSLISKAIFYIKESDTAVAVECLYKPNSLKMPQYVKFYSLRELVEIYNRNEAALYGRCVFVSLEPGKEWKEFETLCTMFFNVHWIKRIDWEFVWKKSVGDINPIKECLEIGKTFTVSEEEFVKDLESPVVVSGEAGMGKTYLMSHMTPLLKQYYPDRWIVLVKLSLYCDHLEKISSINKSDIQEITMKSLKLSKTQVSFFIQTFQNFENFIFLLDGFDEIGPHYTDKAVDLIKILNSCQSFVYISSRQIYTTLLENEFSVIPYRMQPLSESVKKQFLQMIWKLKYPEVSKDVLELRSSYLLEQYSKILNDLENNFIENPLHIRMLAEIYEVNIACNEGITNDLPVNILQIYTQYVNKKFNILYAEKTGANIYIPIVKRELKASASNFIEQNKNLCATYIFGEVNLDEEFIKKLRDDTQEYVMEIESKIEKTGIIENISNGNINYVHRSFAEFFAALWLVDNYKANKIILKETLFKKEMEVVRIFFELKCAENLPLHTAVLVKERQLVASVINARSNINDVDVVGRTSLHLAVANNDVETTQILLDLDVDLSLKDNIGWMPIDYGIQTRSWEVLDLLVGKPFCNDRRGEQLWNRIEKYKNEIIFSCCQKSLLNLFDIIFQNITIDANYPFPDDLKSYRINNNLHPKRKCETYNPIHLAAEFSSVNILAKLFAHNHNLEVNNESGYSLMHVASCNGDIKLLKYLMENGLSVNASCTSSGMFDETPLHLACMNGHLSIVDELVKNGADVNIKSSFTGNTALLSSCISGNVDILNYFYMHGNSLDQVNNNGNNALLLGSEYSHFEIVRYCVEHGADVNFTNYNGRNAVFLAYELANFEIIKYCVEHGVNVNHIDEYGKTALLLFSVGGSKDIIEYLLNHGADISAMDKRGNTALLISAEHNSLDAFQCIHQYGADVMHSNDIGNTALLIAAESGKLDIVSYLLESGADPNHDVNKNGDTALLLAAKGDHFDMVQYLLEHGADVNHVNNDGYTALLLASKNDKLPIVQYCVEHGADLNHANEDGDTAMHFAAHFDNLDILSFCVKNNNMNINCANNGGNTALLLGARYGWMNIVQFCVENGADLDHTNKQGSSALILASTFDNVHILQYLIENGANINYANEVGNTALLTTCMNGKLGIVKYLLLNGAELNHVNIEGNCSFFFAIKSGNLDLVKFIVECGMDINYANKDGNTALLIACHYDRIRIVRYIIECKAQVDHRNNEGNTALMIASCNGSLDIVKLLIEHGANINFVNNDADNILLLALRENMADEEILNVHRERLYPSKLLDVSGTVKSSKYDMPLINFIQFCMQQGIDINYANINDDTALLLACEHCSLDVVKFIVQNGANLNRVNHCGNSALMNACWFGRLEIVKYLIENGANLNLSNADGDTALLLLLLARKNVKLEIIDLFAKYGAKFDSSNNFRETVPVLASEYGRLDIIKYCVEHESCLQLPDNYRNSVLFRACLSPNIKIVQYIIEHGACVNHTDKHGRTPLFDSCLYRCFEIVRYLLENGAHVNHCDNNGETPLFKSCFDENFDIFKYLVEHGADLNHRNKYGQNVMAVASTNGCTKITEYCIEYESKNH